MAPDRDAPPKPADPRPHGRSGRRLAGFFLWVLLAAFVAAFVAAPAAAFTRRVALDDGMVAALTDELEIYLEAPPSRGEGWLGFSRRLTGGEEAAESISESNGRPRKMLAGARYRVPYRWLTEELKFTVVKALLPADGPRSEGWYHEVPAGGPGHGLWRLAEWLTGDGRNFSTLRSFNQLQDDTVPPGGHLLIPPELLLPPFFAALPPRTAPTGAEFDYVRDGTGEFLLYRLKRGEALYSAVVMRFTGRTFAEDVNALARELVTINRIPDVTDMPVGQPVRVPFDMLLPEYLPAADPRRREYETNREASERFSNTVRTSTLEGITVILDAGHGGEDPGTNPDGVWESSYVYDIMLRIKRLLETRTAARVYPTTRDGARFEIPEHDRLPRSRSHVVLTDPPYPIVDTIPGTHLRWYFANSVHRSAVKKSGDPQKTIFISIHADALHPSVRGAMAYIPAASLTQGEYGKSGAVYDSRREVREQPRVEFSWKERVQSEGLSRQLATHLIAGFRRQGLAVHPEKAIRDRIIRCRRCRPWVPAVVRRNAVPAKLLLEVCNLNNAEDQRLLQTRAFRERVAGAVVDGILAYYGESAEARPLAASAAP